METNRYACIFWSKDESDADLTDMAQRSAHVPGVTDTSSSRRKNYSTQDHLSFSSTQIKQKLNMHHSQKKREQTPALRSSMTSGNPSKKDKQSVAGEPPSLKDLRPEDKKRVANLIRELAKTGEEKEVAKEQLEVERRENEMKTKKLQNQIEAILHERENIQQQYLECQKLLSSYQSKVSEEQRNPLGSLQDRSSSQKGQNDGWSPIKESVRTISPPSDHLASKVGHDFVELQSVPVRSGEVKSHHNSKSFIAPPGSRRNFGGPSEQQSPNNHHGNSEREFNPVLSSTHRPHHISRVPSARTEDARTAQNEIRVNGSSSTQRHRHEQQKQSDSHDLSKAHGSQKEGSIRTSQETFFPLIEVTDDSAGTHVHHAKRHGGGESRKSADRNSWVSLPEMDEQFPYSNELRKKGLGQNETSYWNGSQYPVEILPASVSDAEFSRQRQQFESVASSQYDNNHQTSINADHQRHIRNNGLHSPKQHVEAHQKRPDYHSLTPEQRQRQLGSLKKKLQQEQGWLQQKLQEQERLLYHKRLEIQRQKQELSQLDDTGYEQVRRKYLGNGRSGEQHSERTGVGDEYRTRLKRNKIIQEDGYEKRLVPEGGKDEAASPWHQHGPWEEEYPVSTNYPPDDLGEGSQQEVTGAIAGDQFSNYRQRHIAGYDEEDDLIYQDYDDEDEETWYEMREETEGVDNRGSIQGYASFHPQEDTRRQAAADPASSGTYQSYHTPGLRDTVNGTEVRLGRGYPSRINEPQKQFGNITTLLEEEGLAGLSLNISDPPYTKPGTKPRPDTTTTHNGRVGARLHPSYQSSIRTRHHADMRMHPGGQDLTRERDGVTMEVYSPQSRLGKNQRITTHSTAGQAKRSDKGSPYSYEDAARDDALHSHLVQRSHQVIQEIGMLLNQSAEMSQEEESKVLEDVFFLK